MTQRACLRVYRKPPDLGAASLREFVDALREAIDRQRALAETVPGILRPTAELIERDDAVVMAHAPAVPAFADALIGGSGPGAPPDELFAFTLDSAAVLRAAHEHPRSPIHGGICPAAFLRDPDSGMLLIADFGVAAAYARASSAAYQSLAVRVGASGEEATATWECLPDSEENRDDRLGPFVDYLKHHSRNFTTFRRTNDVYALGIVIYLMAHRRHPYLDNAEDHRFPGILSELITGAVAQPVVRPDLRAATSGAIAEWRRHVDRMCRSTEAERPTLPDLLKDLQPLRVQKRDPAEFTKLLESRLWLLIEADPSAKLGGTRALTAAVLELAFTSAQQDRLRGRVRIAMQEALPEITPIEAPFEFDCASDRADFVLSAEDRQSLTAWFRKYGSAVQNAALGSLAALLAPRHAAAALSVQDALPRATAAAELRLAPDAPPAAVSLRWSDAKRAWEWADPRVPATLITERLRDAALAVIREAVAAAVARSDSAAEDGSKLGPIESAVAWVALSGGVDELVKRVALSGTLTLSSPRAAPGASPQTVRVTVTLEPGGAATISAGANELAAGVQKLRPPPVPKPVPPPAPPAAPPKAVAPPVAQAAPSAGVNREDVAPSASTPAKPSSPGAEKQEGAPSAPAPSSAAAPASPPSSPAGPTAADKPEAARPAVEKPAVEKPRKPVAERTEKAAKPAAGSKPAESKPVDAGLGAKPGAASGGAKPGDAKSAAADPAGARGAAGVQGAASVASSKADEKKKATQPPAGGSAAASGGKPPAAGGAGPPGAGGAKPADGGGAKPSSAGSASMPTATAGADDGRRRRALMLGGAGVGVLAVALVLIFALRGNRPQGEAPPPPPPALTGACCIPGADAEAAESCRVISSADCTSAGGRYVGDNTSCTPTPCKVESAPPPPPPPPPLTGACCIPGADAGAAESCQVMSSADCTSAGGRYVGDNTSCTPTPCKLESAPPPPPPPPLAGACCLPIPDGGGSNCTADLSRADCEARGGLYAGDASACAVCPPPRPSSARTLAELIAWSNSASDEQWTLAGRVYSAALVEELRLLRLLPEVASSGVDAVTGDRPGSPLAAEISQLPLSIEVCGEAYRGFVVPLEPGDSAAYSFVILYVQTSLTAADRAGTPADAVSRVAASCEAGVRESPAVAALRPRIALPTVAQWQALARALAPAATTDGPLSALARELFWGQPEWVLATDGPPLLVGGVTIDPPAAGGMPRLVPALRAGDLEAWLANPLARPRAREDGGVVRRVIVVWSGR
ncbi:MAG: hypothetical protein IPM64_02475 [Phycisphaerales bacterium]|nr:hypothetical protein [Phycisphaerales bacterium]